MGIPTERSALIHYTAFEPDTEVLGSMLQGTVAFMERESLLPLLRKYGFEQIAPDQWYPLQRVLDLFSDLVNGASGMFDMIGIGMKVGEVFQFPPEVTTFEQALELADTMNKAVYRNGDPGTIRAEKLGERHYKLHVHLPFPQDLHYGIWWAVAKRLVPDMRTLKIRREVIDLYTGVYEFRW
ncbi:MAG: hypothetical protein CUN51_03335 [Candidatus Thermofonsia Clade 1 bacterium]|uniref:Uncharacterized protein n=1 Tax=Candidatus Thermofonsia Clade 1 bacterium TaxID=2364210 RepID=A0A2M8P1F2_9CHLR|nr:MAG: hypothetical protein CUN51_03335 [Candidatus Thermofonsia Clade 1 bacterium]